MTHFYLGALMALALVIPSFLYRAITGPTLFDRLIGLNGISTKAILLLILIGAASERTDMFLDISLGYGLINLIGALAVGKYLEKRGLQ